MNEVGIMTAIEAYKSLGILGFLIVAMVVAFAFMVWRIVRTQDRITSLQDNLFAKMNTMCSTLAVHDRQGQEIHESMGKAEFCLTGIKTQLAEIKGKIR